MKLSISEQPTFRGKVVLARFRGIVENGGYGFIRPDGGGKDVWFSLYATQGRVLKVGQVVDYVAMAGEDSTKRPRAFRVWKRVTEGENEDVAQIETSSEDQRRAREEAASWSAHRTAIGRA
jgi:cold shock CspA family protein